MRKICDRSPPARAARFLAVVGCAVLITATSASATTLIDGFNDGTFSITATHESKVATKSQSGLTDVVGAAGERDVRLEWLSDGTSDTVTAAVVSENRLTYNNAVGLVSKLELKYGYGSGDLDNLNADFTEGGQQAFIIEFLLANQVLSVDFEIFTTGKTSSVVTHNTPAAANTLFFWFSEFDSSKVDMFDVDKIRIQFNAVNDGGYRIDFISSTIPEPLTMLGVFVGIAGISGYLRKHRRA